LQKILLYLLLIALFVSGSASAAVPADDSEWQPIAPGIDYRKYQLPDPNNVFVARMDRANPTVTVESTLAQDKLIEGRETVSSMFSRYDQALNFWGDNSSPPAPGTRGQAVVGINGAYFDLVSGVPQGGMVQSGWYVKRYDKLGGWGGFAWKLDRSAFISECLNNDFQKQFVTYSATGVTQTIARVNAPRTTNNLIMYTPQYNTQTLNDNSGVEVVVELKAPTMIMPQPAYVSGVVRQIRDHEGKTLIPFNSIVLSAAGKAADTLLQNVKIGSEVRITQEITSYEYDCSTPLYLPWTKTYTSIQGAYFYLKNGQFRDFYDSGAVARNPRSAIAFDDQYIYFIVVDGRDYYHSIGMTIHELALFTRDVLGATSGVSQDGGGSSTLVINGQVVNNTYCNLYSCSGYYTPYVPPSANNFNEEVSDLQTKSSVVNSPAGIERTVANGLLMVVVQPGEFSRAFRPGESVATLINTETRLGPGSNYAAFSTVPLGSYGRILDQINGLEGVLAKSTYWWYVDFGDVTGWVPQEALTKLATEFDLLDWLTAH
jgi:hypothetical protein